MKNEKYSDLAEVLPHKPPMILIDRVLSYDLESLGLIAEFDATENAMFFDAALGGIPPWAGLEYMAQATAALSGINNLEIGGEKPKMGFVLGTRRYQNNIEYYKKGKTYTVEVGKLFYDSSLGSFQCTIREVGGDVCARAEINVFSPDNVEEFLKEGGANG
jgi:predicted hotdog family 3-hydroxylacyl-ACP dehydratase